MRHVAKRGRSDLRAQVTAYAHVARQVRSDRSTDAVLFCRTARVEAAASSSKAGVARRSRVL
eukprot:7329341-Alexandrium_andersonii.AAC.1